MKIVSHLALLGALVGAVQACATPVDLKGCPAALPSADCDVLLASSSDFPDAGLGGAAGNGSGGAGPGPSGAGAGGGGPVGQGGASNLGGGGTGSGLGGAGQGGNSGLGGAGLGGAAGAGLGGAGGGAGTGGAGSQGTFDPESCDFTDRTGCEDLGCQNCPDNNFCPTNCPPIIACVEANLGCSTAIDPLCGARNGSVENVCLPEVEPSGGANPTQAGSPAAFARALVECLCTVPRL